MPFSKTSFVILALRAAVTVLAHGHITDVSVEGTSFRAFNPQQDPFKNPTPQSVTWSTSAMDNGFISKSEYGSGDIVCHKNASNAQLTATVAAGENLTLTWSEWPDSHHGPVLDYLASCGSAGCVSADKMSLKFFKINEAGLIDNTKAPGTWASDQIIKGGLKWSVQIPASIAPGEYVLRHEIIALQATGDPQHYPQCMNLNVTGSGTEAPQGVLGTELYKASDPGLTFDLYKSGQTYPSPGPALFSAAAA